MPRYATDVVENDSKFDAFCNDTNQGSACFVSSGWETEELAKARIHEHLTEHATGTHARELGAFQLGVSQEEYEVLVAKWLEANSVELPDAGEVSE